MPALFDSYFFPLPPEREPLALPPDLDPPRDDPELFEPPDLDPLLGLAFGVDPPEPDDLLGLAFGVDPPEPDDLLGLAFGCELPELRAGVRALVVSRELELERGSALVGVDLLGVG